MNKLLTYSIIVVKVIGETFFVFGLIGWMYGVFVQFVDWQLLYLPISHLTLFLRLDTYAIISFVASAVGFLMWRLAKETISFARKDKTNAG